MAAAALPVLPTARLRLGAALVAYVLLVGLAVVVLRAPLHRALGPQPLVFSAYAAVLVPTIGLAAVVLWLRARVLRTVRSSLLAAAYVYALPLVLLHILTLPDDGVANGAQNLGVSVWSYAVWHVGWFALFAAYAWAPSRFKVHTERIVIPVAVASLAFTIALAVNGAPPLILAVPAGAWQAGAYVVSGTFIALLVTALAGVTLRRVQSFLDLWLLAAFAAMYAATLAMVAGEARYSLGAYVGRSIGVLDSLLVLVAVGADYLRSLRRSTAAQRLADIAEALPVIVLLLERSGSCTFVNHNWTVLTRQSRTAALGFGYRAMIHPEDRAALARHAELDGPLRPFEFQLRLRSPGRWRWHQLNVTPMRRPDRAAEWLGVAMDVEERVRAATDLSEALGTARQVAASLQDAFLPSSLPAIAGVNVRATYRSSTRSGPIGGDWYDVFELPDGRVAVVIGDVTGHGLAASAGMVRLRETLRAAAALEEASPERILARANAAATFGRETIASALFGVLDPELLTFAYATAGHPPPMLVRDGRVIALPSGGVLLGADPTSNYAGHTEPLAAGDRLVLFTDGLIEAAHDIVDGEQRLRAALEDGVLDPELLIEAVAGSVLGDDVAVLTLEITESAARTARAPWRFLSDDALIATPSRASFTAYLRRRGIDEENVAVAEMVFGELVGNVVRHAPGPIEIELSWADVPAIVVRDRGPGFELRETLPDLFSESGRGLFLMRSLGAELSVSPRLGGGSETVARLPALRSRDAAHAT